MRITITWLDEARVWHPKENTCYAMKPTRVIYDYVTGWGPCLASKESGQMGFILIDYLIPEYGPCLVL